MKGLGEFLVNFFRGQNAIEFSHGDHFGPNRAATLEFARSTGGNDLSFQPEHHAKSPKTGIDGIDISN